FVTSHLSFIYQHTHAVSIFFLFLFTATSSSDIYTLSLHDALPILSARSPSNNWSAPIMIDLPAPVSPVIAVNPGEISHSKSSTRSEEHTSELQSRENLVCRLLLEKKKKKKIERHKIRCQLLLLSAS